MMRMIVLSAALSLIAGCASVPDAPDPAAGTAREPARQHDGCPAPSTEPATGRVAGGAFAVEASKIENGILELRQDDDFVPDRSLTLFLFLDEGEIPAGRTFEFDADAGFGAPHVHMNWKRETDFDNEIFTDGYRLRLSFLDERDGMLPGTIHLCLPDDAGSWVSGTFEAAVKGFRLVDGKPDLSQDAMKNFEYLALEHLETTLEGEVAIESVERTRYTHPGPSGPQVGSADVTYRVADGRQTRRFLFVKLDDHWRVDKMLAMDRLAEAHPYAVPDGAPFVHALLAWVVAREIETRVRTEHPGSAIYPGNDFSVVETYRADDDRADVQASYRLEDSRDKIVLRLVLERADDGWQVASYEPAG